MTSKKLIRPAVFGAGALLVLLNIFFSYLYSSNFSQAINHSIHDEAATSISITMLFILVLSVVIITVLALKLAYDYFKKNTSLSFWNWSAIVLLVCYVVTVGNFLRIFLLV